MAGPALLGFRHVFLPGAIFFWNERNSVVIAPCYFAGLGACRKPNCWGDVRFATRCAILLHRKPGSWRARAAIDGRCRFCFDRIGAHAERIARETAPPQWSFTVRKCEQV